MSGPVRWAAAGAASVVSFALAVWLVRALPWGWLPKDDGDRWAVATACGAVVAAGVLYGLTWWTSRGGAPAAPGGGRRVRQYADAGGDSVVEQTAGTRTRRRTPGTPPEHLTQRAKTRGTSRIRQTGGDDGSY
ncbi:hypothetical protein [Streptomyces sp. NPDC089799]|uniref:hypothetical protein n=1 Tax=Streptomyces sp. NPDC089799 TaxID=3155066 RepID=UPI0034151FDF